ncbi:MAG: ABC transporter permease [Pseudomonadota bacterium]
MNSPGNRARYHLLLLSAWRYAAQHRWQTWLSFLGIMLGVMMVVAVDLANSSAQRAFALSVAAVNGNITHQIVGGSSGVPDSVFTGLRTELGLRNSAPSLSARIRVGRTELTLIGVDFSSEATLQRRRPGLATESLQMSGLALAALTRADAVMMSEETAQTAGLAVDQVFTLESAEGAQSAILAATFASSEPVATEGLVFADIATAQSLLAQRGSIDSIDLVLADDDIETLRSWLPVGLTLVEVNARNAALEQMTSAFGVNLLAMSLLALLVAGLLIYNTVSLSVLQRQQTLGVMRSLGVSRREVIMLILLESIVRGVLASCAGVVMGLVLGQGLVKLVTRTIDDLYFNLSVTSFLLDPFVLGKGLLWGTGVSLLAAAIPAWQAGRAQPVTLQQRAVQDSKIQKQLPMLALCGGLVMGAGLLLLLPENGSLVTGFVALNLLIFGFCLLIPLAMHFSLQLFFYGFNRRLSQRTRLALRNIQSGISRTGMAVAALTVAVSVTVGVGIMVGSFRQTVILWLDQTLSGDVQVTRLDNDAGAVSAEFETFVREQLQVGSLTRVFNQRVESSAGEVRVAAYGDGMAANLFIKTASQEGLQAAEAGTALLVSEPFAYLNNLEIDDTVTLYSPQGSLTLPVAGVFYDYTSGAGMVAIAQQLYVQWWPESLPNSLILHAAEGQDLTALQRDLRSYTTDLPGNWGVAANADIRRITLTIFDRTFAITHVLRLLAIGVAFVGVLSALIALQLERMREYALLRATGMTVREVAGMIGVQTLVMGVLAGLFALPLGLLMSDVLIDVINKRSFGWSMLHILPASVLIQAMLLAIIAAGLAGIYPAIRVAGVSPAQGLREE